MTKEVRIWIVDKRRERPLWQRLVVVSFTFAVLFGPGVLADSAAMQWAGFLVLLFGLALILLSTDFKSMTISEAKTLLAELDAE